MNPRGSPPRRYVKYPRDQRSPGPGPVSRRPDSAEDNETCSRAPKDLGAVSGSFVSAANSGDLELCTTPVDLQHSQRQRAWQI